MMDDNRWIYGHGTYGNTAIVIFILFCLAGWFLGPHLQFFNGWGILVDLLNGIFGPVLTPPGPRYIIAQESLGFWALPVGVLILFSLPVIISIPLVEFSLWLVASCKEKYLK